MNKKLEIDFIISKIREKINELLDQEESDIDQLSAGELVNLATNLVTYATITPEYNQPIGFVDTTQVQFVLDDDTLVMIGAIEYDEDQVLQSDD